MCSYLFAKGIPDEMWNRTYPDSDRREARLYVHSVPRIVASSLPNIRSQVFWGQTKVLSCEAEGNPPPEVVWYKDAEELPATAWKGQGVVSMVPTVCFEVAYV